MLIPQPSQDTPSIEDNFSSTGKPDAITDYTPSKSDKPSPKKVAGKALSQAGKSMASTQSQLPSPKSGPEMSALGEPLGNYKKGTPYVPKTGNYKLHEGEAVIPKEENEVADALGGKAPKNSPKEEKKESKSTKKAEKPTVHHMSIHRVKGGHIVHHHHQPHEEGDGRKPDATHVVGNGPEGEGDISNLAQHLQDHMGSPAPEVGLPEGAAAPAPAAGSAPPAAAIGA